LTRITLPYGGALRYQYRSFTYGSGVTVREVQNRYLTKAAGATEAQYSFVHDDAADASLSLHGYTFVVDPSGPANGWWFSSEAGWRLGLATAHERRVNLATSSPLPRRQDFTYSQDSAGNGYLSAVTTTLDGQKTTKTEQALDTHGNLLWTRVYDYGNLSTPARTYTNTYLTGSEYVSRHIWNRLTSSSVSAGSTNATLVTSVYDAWSPMADRPGLAAHDPTYSVDFKWRGNLIQRTSAGRSFTYSYDIGGILTSSSDGSSYTSYTLDGNTLSVPSTITPNSTGELATSYTYTNALDIASVTGPNQAQASVTYDGGGRPTRSVSVHGAATTYAYTTNTVTATTNSHWTRTTLDGLGRKVKTEIGDSGGAKSVVDIEYDSCACSPLGKVKRVSQPYAPGGAVYWTTYTYDALGRTTRIDLPGGTGATTYSYVGNTTTVTDAAGKWKKYTVDAMGNLIQVTEPAPEGGTHETYYAYNLRSQLTQVTMPRGTTTQTRTFNYDLATGRLMSTTNPENGTVSYTYNANGTVATKTDAKQQRTEYSYDGLARVTEIRHYVNPYHPAEEDSQQRVTFTYDTAENGWGRLASAQTTLNEITSFKYTPGA